MESLLSEMEAAGGSCSADDCEASYEVTEVWVNEKKGKRRRRKGGVWLTW